MTNQPPIYCKKVTEKSTPRINLSNSEIVLNKTEDFNSIVVMSGTATRKPLEKKENRYVRKVQKNNFKENFSKLRVPSGKPPHKNSATVEKLMTKSCEILFECIKPYKDIRVARKTQVRKESIRTFGSILTTDIIYERKATRKVEFFSFSEDNESFLTDKQSQVLTAEIDTEKFAEWELEDLFSESATKSITPSNGVKQTGKTVSSEDFIINAFPEM